MIENDIAQRFIPCDTSSLVKSLVQETYFSPGHTIGSNSAKVFLSNILNLKNYKTLEHLQVINRKDKHNNITDNALTKNSAL